ncbi:hypothetical protein GCM10020256_71240 [Streptomyces thermocoprophilus]
MRCGTLVCHWHGLALDGRPAAGWEPLPVHDDGVLLWVRLDDAGGETPLPAPVLPGRPDPQAALTAVCEATGVCEPEDVIANRLDPWHGAWFHPYSFVDLTVTGTPGDEDDDRFTVDVSFKVAGRLVVPVRAVFTAPEPRTVVMHIAEGEGAGSVVETHATPLGPDERGRPRTAVVEAVVAASDRRGFAAARAAAPLLRPPDAHRGGPAVARRPRLRGTPLAAAGHGTLPRLTPRLRLAGKTPGPVGGGGMARSAPADRWEGAARRAGTARSGGPGRRAVRGRGTTPGPPRTARRVVPRAPLRTVRRTPAAAAAAGRPAPYKAGRLLAILDEPGEGGRTVTGAGARDGGTAGWSRAATGFWNASGAAVWARCGGPGTSPSGGRSPSSA